jgi:drug/metabolite transporter (DMT)-like permease
MDTVRRVVGHGLLGYHAGDVAAAVGPFFLHGTCPHVCLPGQRVATMTSNLRAIVAMLAAMAMFSCMDALLKALAGTYPPLQVTALRGLTAMPLVCAYILWRGETRAVFARTLRWRLHLLRGVCSVAMMGLFTYGLKTLGLAEAYTLAFVAPLILVALSVPVLREVVLRRQWVAIVVGLVGVVIAMRPQPGALVSLGALAILLAAGFYAASNVVGRLVSRSEPSVTLVFWTTVSLAVGGSVLGAADWVDVRGEHISILLGLAVTGFLGQLSITEAFRHGQAAVIAPFEYSALAWAVLLDWLFWQTVPQSHTLLGGAIIVASGLYLIRREAPAVPRRVQA